MSGNCQIPQWGTCCCTCKYHLKDFYHCTTVDDLLHKAMGGGCVCDKPKGWICAAPEMERIYSGWTEHGMCEMHTPTPPPDRGRE